MATSLQMSNTNKEEINHQPPIRRRGTLRRKPRDSFSSSKHQKQPRRGMGVEKLERLRIQERWKKMTETNIEEESFAHNDHHHGAKPGHVGFNTQQQNQQRFVKGGFNGSSFHGKYVNMVTEINVSEHCSVCISEKKRVSGENLGAMRSDMLRQMSSFGDSINFLGLRFGENKDSVFNQRISSLGIRTYKPPLMPQLGSCAAAVTNKKQGVEIVAVHKKGSAEDGNNTVLTEYEVFPSLKETSDQSHRKDDDDLTMMKLSNNIKSSEASCSCKYCDYYQGDFCGNNNASSSEASVVDLSLKLWY